MEKINHGFGKRNAGGEPVRVTESTSVSTSFHAAIDAMREAKDKDRVSVGRWIIRGLLFVMLLESIRALIF